MRASRSSRIPPGPRGGRGSPVSSRIRRSRSPRRATRRPDSGFRSPGTMTGMAVTPAAEKLDARKLRADFPVFERPIHGKPLAFLDSAASTQKPRQVLDALYEFYAYSYANVHRGVYDLAERATAGFEGAREKVARFINAPEIEECIFVRQATEALNLVAYAWG